MSRDDADKSALGEGGDAFGFALHLFDDVDSTNDAARDLAQKTPGRDLAIAARSQRAGRGRHGRAWASPPGNLYLTLAIWPERPLGEWGALSLVASLAMAEGLERLGHGAGLSIKWPNDLLRDGAKLAGILLEAPGAPVDRDGRPLLLIGSGVNLAHAPAMRDRAVADLGAAPGGPPPPEDLRSAYLARFRARYDQWRAQGFGALMGDWSARAHRRGDPLTIKLGAGSKSGRFAGVAEDGALLLEGRGGVETIRSGEIMGNAGSR